MAFFQPIRYALTTLPLRRQEVHTRRRLVAPFTLARTGRRLTFQRRLLTLWAWLMVFPNCGPLPQISQTRAITLESFQACCRNLDFTGMSPISPKQNRTVSTGNLFATRAGGVCVATSVPSLRDS